MSIFFLKINFTLWRIGTGIFLFCQLFSCLAGEVFEHAAPQRIISQTLASDEILLALCPKARILALSTLAREASYSNVVEQSQTIPQVGRDPESIVSLNPDLVFVASYSRAEVVNLLQVSGIKLVRLSAFSRFADIEHNVQLIGDAIQRPDAAAQLIQSMQQELAQLQNRIPAQNPPQRVLLWTEGYTAGNNTLFNDASRYAHLINLAAEKGIDGHVKISEEVLFSWQPDILISEASPQQQQLLKKKLLQHPLIQQTPAGKKERIIVLDRRYSSAASQYWVQGVRQLIEAVYLSH